MAKEDLLLAPEGLEALRAGLKDLVPALGPHLRPQLEHVGNLLDRAIAARQAGDTRGALRGVLEAMRQLALLGDALGGNEGAAMRAMAGGFEKAMAGGHEAEAAQLVDGMRERSGAQRKRDTVPDL